MRKLLFALFGLMVFLLVPNLILADCLDLSNFTSWALEDPHTIIFYRDRRPLARLKIPDCTIQPTSRVRLIQSYLCGGDKIQIDDEICVIMTLQVID